MQLDEFFGDVVLDSFNVAYMDEDKILDQINKCKYVCSDFYYDFNSL